MTAGSDIATTIRHGNVDSFACWLRFYPEPDAEPSLDPDLAQSWGELSLWVHGRNLCAHWMHAHAHEGVHWYLLSFLEWLAENWDPLLHEERLPCRDSGSGAAADVLHAPVRVSATAEEAIERFGIQQDWMQRHAIHASADGGLFPQVFLRRRRSAVEVSWHNTELAFAPDDFVFSGDRTGYEVVAASAVADALYGVLRDATQLLAGTAAHSPRVRQLERVVEALPDESRTDRRIAWLAGLGRTVQESSERWVAARQLALSAAKDRSADAVRAALDPHAHPLFVDGTCRAAVLFGSMSPLIQDVDIQQIARMLVGAYDPSYEHSELDEISANVDAGYDDDAWQEGYALADRVHQELAFDTAERIDIVDTIKRLGIRRTSIELSDPKVRGISLTSPVHHPTIAVNARFENNRRESVLRFTLAHELCHVLFDQDFDHELAMASGPWAPAALEKRANAFAAMFLMPRDLVRRAVADATEPPETLAGVRQLAQRMETSISTTIDHLFNLDEIDGFSRERLREELDFVFG